MQDVWDSGFTSNPHEQARNSTDVQCFRNTVFSPDQARTHALSALTRQRQQTDFSSPVDARNSVTDPRFSVIRADSGCFGSYATIPTETRANATALGTCFPELTTNFGSLDNKRPRSSPPGFGSPDLGPRTLFDQTPMTASNNGDSSLFNFANQNTRIQQPFAAFSSRIQTEPRPL